MKLILSLFIILFISLCNGVRIRKVDHQHQHVYSKGLPSTFINYIPYDSNCQNSINGVGFGVVSNQFTCLINSTTTSIDSFLIEGDKYVNLTSSHQNYCANPVYSQILKVGTCGFYEYSSTNYQVTVTPEPVIPTGSYLIEQYDSACKNQLTYWFAPTGTTIVDYKQPLETTYQCVSGKPQTTICIQDSCKTIPTSQPKCSEQNPTIIRCV